MSTYEAVIEVTLQADSDDEALDKLSSALESIGITEYVIGDLVNKTVPNILELIKQGDRTALEELGYTSDRIDHWFRMVKDASTSE